MYGFCEDEIESEEFQVEMSARPLDACDADEYGSRRGHLRVTRGKKGMDVLLNPL